MKYLLLFLLAGCAGLPLTETEQIQTAVSIAGNVATGNYTGAALEALDVVWVFLGYKGLGLAKRKLVNPKVAA